jgi:hypothetical protein
MQGTEIYVGGQMTYLDVRKGRGRRVAQHRNAWSPTPPSTRSHSPETPQSVSASPDWPWLGSNA